MRWQRALSSALKRPPVHSAHAHAEACYFRRMPGRHRKVGMNRPKKKKVDAWTPELVENTIEDTVLVEEVVPKVTLAPEPAPPARMPVPDEQTDLMAEYTKLSQLYHDALDKAIVVKRRWLKTRDTYFSDPCHYHWGITASEQARVLERLNQADFELKQAARKKADFRQELRLLNSLRIFAMLMSLHPRKKALPRLALMAGVRLLRFRKRNNLAMCVTPTPIMGPGEVTGYLIETFGLAQAWGVMTVSEFKA